MVRPEPQHHPTQLSRTITLPQYPLNFGLGTNWSQAPPTQTKPSIRQSDSQNGVVQRSPKILQTLVNSEVRFVAAGGGAKGEEGEGRSRRSQRWRWKGVKKKSKRVKSGVLEGGGRGEEVGNCTAGGSGGRCGGSHQWLLLFFPGQATYLARGVAGGEPPWVSTGTHARPAPYMPCCEVVGPPPPSLLLLLRRLIIS